MFHCLSSLGGEQKKWRLPRLIKQYSSENLSFLSLSSWVFRSLVSLSHCSSLLCFSLFKASIWRLNSFMVSAGSSYPKTLTPQKFRLVKELPPDFSILIRFPTTPSPGQLTVNHYPATKLGTAPQSVPSMDTIAPDS